MTMGLEPMHPMDWIEIDEHYEEEMALRRELVKEKRDIVIHSLPGVGQMRKTSSHELMPTSACELCSPKHANLKTSVWCRLRLLMLRCLSSWQTSYPSGSLTASQKMAMC